MPPTTPTAAPPLQLRLKKGNDGRIASFALHRQDGSVTVMRNPNAFFPLHDLTHYAVENVLRFRRGFYGLVCDGWDFEDFGSPWPRGPLPADTDPAETIVGMFDLERATGHEMAAADANEHLQRYLVEHPAVRPVALTPDHLATIRARVNEYRQRWSALAPGDTLVLSYVPGEDRHA